MRSRRVAAAVAVTVSAALVLGACGGGSSDTSGDPAGEGAQTDTIISYANTEPQNPLVPANTNEVGGGKVVSALFSMLTDFRSDTSEQYNQVAESIESPDAQNWTITLREGWTFHDGTPVTASSFVDAWNYGALATNGQIASSFFSQIQGFDQVNPEDPDGEDGPQAAPAPAAQTMSGLAVVDDRTFTVALNAPFSVFPTTLAYTAFAPLPQAFFDDPTGFEANPIGNGAFRFSERVPGVSITVTRFDEWAGEQKPTIGGVEFRNYEDPAAAYADVIAGNLDFQDVLPPTALVGRLFETDLADRYVQQPSLTTSAISFPLYDPRYQNVQVRQAISMAIDRQTITDNVYEGARVPATGFIPSSLDGYVEGQCGEFCTFNPQRAAELFAQSGFTGPLELATNIDGAGNQEAFQAICVSVSNALGVPCTVQPTPTFAEFREASVGRTHTAPFRTGWQADYPSPENFLNPLYKTGASSNDSVYSNPEVDALLAQADSAASVEEAITGYQAAERRILQDLPSIPTFEVTSTAGWSPRLQNVTVDSIDGELDLKSVTVSE